MSLLQPGKACVACRNQPWPVCDASVCVARFIREQAMPEDQDGVNCKSSRLAIGWCFEQTLRILQTSCITAGPRSRTALSCARAKVRQSVVAYHRSALGACEGHTGSDSATTGVHGPHVLAGDHQSVACSRGIAGRQMVDEGGDCDLLSRACAGGRTCQARFWRFAAGLGVRTA